MRLKPRYSLLTLLILMALVAGGVKLRYGPHRVVEERETGKQLEYTYTRVWNGEKIVHGPFIMRMIEPNGPSLFIVVTYVLNEQKLRCFYVLTKQNKNSPNRRQLLSDEDFESIPKMPLMESEQLLFRQAIDHERKRLNQDAGAEFVWFELIGDAEDPGEQIHTYREFEAHYEELLNKSWDYFMRPL